MEPVLLSVLVIAGSMAAFRRLIGHRHDNKHLRQDKSRQDDLTTALRAIHHIGETTRADIDRTDAEFEAIVKQAAHSGREEKRR